MTYYKMYIKVYLTYSNKLFNCNNIDMNADKMQKHGVFEAMNEKTPTI